MNEEARNKARTAGKDKYTCVCGGILPVSCTPSKGWYGTNCTQTNARLQFLKRGQRMPDGRGHKKGQRGGRSPNTQPRERSALHPCCKLALACRSLVVVKRKVPPFWRCLFLLANQHQVRNRVLMSVTFLFLCAIRRLHLICLGIILHDHQAGTNVWDFPLLLYLVVSLSWCIRSRDGKWVAGTAAVRSQRFSGYTKHEGPCDHCEQVASDKDFWRLMHVALGGLKKTSPTLLGVGLLIDRCCDLNTQERLMALNTIRDVSRLDKCVSDYQQLASALAHPNCPPRAGRVFSCLL